MFTILALRCDALVGPSLPRAAAGQLPERLVDGSGPGDCREGPSASPQALTPMGEFEASSCRDWQTSFRGFVPLFLASSACHGKLTSAVTLLHGIIHWGLGIRISTITGTPSVWFTIRTVIKSHGLYWDPLLTHSSVLKSMDAETPLRLAFVIGSTDCGTPVYYGVVLRRQDSAIKTVN